MYKSNLIIGIVSLLFFFYAQTQGWNIFETGPGPKQTSSGGRVYHK